MHKTLKKAFSSTTTAPSSFNNFMNPDPQDDALIHERQRKLRELQEKHAATINVANVTNVANVANVATTHRPVDIKTKIKQTITKKYKLGKTPGGNVVGVLIKDNKTRHRVQEEHGVLRRESIVDIRKYLHDHGLLKIGSDAPPDVLRSMYETAKLTGDVNNVNKHVLLHNFMQSDASQ